MTAETRSSCKIKDDKNNVLKGKHNGKGSDSYGLRSGGYICLKKVASSPSGTRKSERLVNRTPPTPEVKRKCERVEKEQKPSPLLRKRKAGGTQSSPTVSVSQESDNNSGFSVSSWKIARKEKSVKKLTYEAKQVSGIENNNIETCPVKSKIMSAHAYRKLYKKGEKDNSADGQGGACKMDVLSEEGQNNFGTTNDGLGEGAKFSLERNSGALLGSRSGESKLMEEPSTRLKDGCSKFEDGNAESDGGAQLAYSGQRDGCGEFGDVDCLQVSGNELNLSTKQICHMVEEHESSEGACKGVSEGDNYLPLPFNCVDKEKNVDTEGVQFNCFEGVTPLTSACDRELAVNTAVKERDKNLIHINSNDASHMITKGDLNNFIADPVPSPCGCKNGNFMDRCQTCLTGKRFVEYWVPVQMSNMQLEQYCSTLLANALTLCIPLKNDPFGALRNVIISTRKCCDHPYLVDQSLQNFVIEDLQAKESLDVGGKVLDVGIKASGKLEILDFMLTKIKKRGLRVLILFESISGSPRDSMGNILDDFLCQRFGQDSYERIDKAVPSSKTAKARTTSLQMFNNKESGRFVFLLERSACSPSIKLSSVDIIIFYDSDWNPVNDMKSLQKITLELQVEPIKIFRLYLPFSLEEKVLILSKQDKMIDPDNISLSTSHMLLMWGASYLFDKLREIHDKSTSESRVESLIGQSFLQEVIHEFSFLVSQDNKDDNQSNLSIILKVQQSGGTYHTNLPLLGEREIQPMNEWVPNLYWRQLLEGKHPQWKYISGLSQRIRKRVQHFDGSVNGIDNDSADLVKKRKKAVDNVVNETASNSGIEDQISNRNKDGNCGAPAVNDSQAVHVPTTSASSHITNDSFNTHSLADLILDIPKHVIERGRKWRDSQKSLHLLLKPQIAKLYEVIHLPDNVKNMVENFLEYVMKNHHVYRETMSILQAFQISLCWTAASLLKHKIDHKESLILAKQHLSFNCTKEEADYIYSILRCLKRLFSFRTGNLTFTDSLKGSELTGVSQSLTSDMKFVNVKEFLKIQDSSDKQASLGSTLEVELMQKDINRSVKEVRKKFQKHMRKLLQKQQDERNNLGRLCREEEAQLEKAHQVELAVVRSCLPDVPFGTEKLTVVVDEHAKKLEKLKGQCEMRLKNLKAAHLEERQMLQKKESLWLDDLKTWLQIELSYLPPVGSGTAQEYLQINEQVRALNGLKVVNPISDHFSGKQTSHKIGNNIPSVANELPETCLQTVSNEDALCTNSSEPREAQKLMVPLNDASKLDAMDTGAAPSKSEGHRANDSLCVKPGIAVSVDSNPKGNKSTEKHRAKGNLLEGHAAAYSLCDNEGNSASMNVCKNACAYCKGENAATLDTPFSERHASDAGISNNGETDTATPYPEKISYSNPLSSREGIPQRTTLSICDGETASSGNGDENLLSLNPQSSDQHAPTVINLGATNDELVTPEIVSSNQAQYNDVKTSSALSGQNVTDGTTSVLDRGVPQVPLDADDVVPSEPPSSGEPPMNVPNREEPIVLEGVASSDVPNMFANSPPEALIVSRAASDIPDSPSSVEVPGTSEMVGCCNNRESDAMNDFSLDNNTVSDPHDEICRTIDKTSSSLELPVIQPLISSTQVASDSLNQATQCTVPSILNEIIDGNSSARDTQNSVHQEDSISRSAGAMPYNRSDHDTAIMEPIEQVSEDNISNLVSQAPVQAVEGPVEVRSEAAVESISNSEFDSSANATLCVSGSLPTETRNMSITSESNNHPAQTLIQVSSRATLPLSSDPLQNELERIRKEISLMNTNHEDMKLRLISDCQKEIEGATTLIRMKYEMKILEIQNLFQQKMNELETCENMVLRNKTLAEAFRSKCNSSKGYWPSAMQQDGVFMQQLAQLSRQQQRPSVIAGPLSSMPPPSISQGTSSAAGTQIMLPPEIAAQNRPPIFSGVSTRPIVNSVPPAVQFALSCQNTSTAPPPMVPPAQAGRNQPANFSNVSTRYHPTSSSASGNLQAGTELRAPAPHLQLSRPLAPSVSATNISPVLPVGISSQQTSSTNLPAISSVPPQLPTRPPLSTYHPGLHNRGIRPETAGGPLAPLSYLSSLELLVDGLGRSAVNPPILREIGLLNLSEFDRGISRQVNTAPTAGPPSSPDIVCLSDDD